MRIDETGKRRKYWNAKPWLHFGGPVSFLAVPRGGRYIRLDASGEISRAYGPSGRDAIDGAIYSRDWKRAQGYACHCFGHAAVFPPLHYVITTFFNSDLSRPIRVECTEETARVLLPLWSEAEPNATLCREVETGRIIVCWLEDGTAEDNSAPSVPADEKEHGQ